MRLLQITVPEGERDTVTQTLDDRKFNYFMSDEISSKCRHWNRASPRGGK